MTNLWWVGKTIVSSFLDILQEVDDTVCFTNTWNIHWWSSKLKNKVKNELKTIGSNLICEWQCAPSLAEVQILAVHLSMVLRVLLKAPVLWWWDLKRATSTQITSVTTIQWSRSTNTLLQCTHLSIVWMTLMNCSVYKASSSQNTQKISISWKQTDPRCFKRLSQRALFRIFDYRHIWSQMESFYLRFKNLRC